MKSTFSIFLLIGFVGISVFSVFSMNHEGGHDSPLCVTAPLQKTDCPKEDGPLSYVTFHLGVFRSFSAAVFQENLASLVSLFLLVCALMIVLLSNFSFGLLCFKPFAFNQQAIHTFSFEQELARWIALHENSPTFS